MRTHVHTTAQLGELVAAAFDEAELYTRDPEEASVLATKAVMHILRSHRTNLLHPVLPEKRIRHPDRGV